MAIILSAQSGNWEDTTTWVGGVVPTKGDTASVEPAHTVSITTSFICEHNITIKGTLNINATIDVTFGVRSGTAPELIFEGGTLRGAGNVNVVNGSVICTGDAWSYVKDTVGMKYSGSYDGITWELQKFSWQSTGDLDIRYRAPYDAGRTTTFNVRNCCFLNGTVDIGAEGSTVKEAISVNNCTFYNLKTIRLFGKPDKLVTLQDCSIQADAGIRTALQLTLGALNNCTVVNCSNMSFFLGGPSEIRESFIALNQYMVNGAFIVGTASSNGETTLADSIVFCDSEGGTNTRLATLGTITGNFLNISSLDGGNGVICSSNYTNTFTNNVYVGKGGVFTNALTDVPFSATLTNNTTVHTGNELTDTAYTFEYNANIESYVARNNLHVALNEPTATTTYARAFDDPQAVGIIGVDVDYCVKHNITDWFLPIYNNTTGTSLSTIDPTFTDSTRDVTSWASSLGLNSSTELFEYMLTSQGFNKTTGIHSDTPHLIDIKPVHTWLMEGYVPTNMALATAGDTGSYVGALEPKSVVETANLNLGVDKTSSFTNTQLVYSATLDSTLTTNLSVTLTVDGVDRYLTILAGQTTATTTYTPTTAKTVVASVKSTDNANITIVNGSVSTIVTAPVVEPTANLSLESNLSAATVGDDITYTLRLTEAVNDSTSVVLTIAGVDRTVIISAGNVSATTVYTTVSEGSVVADVKSVSNSNVTDTSSTITVSVKAGSVDPPIGDLTNALVVNGKVITRTVSIRINGTIYKEEGGIIDLPSSLFN